MSLRYWDAYARGCPIGPEYFVNEPVQAERVEHILRRCIGTVLDVGGGDGYVSHLLQTRGHEVTLLEVSQVRLDRALADYGIHGELGDATSLPFDDRSFDTVLLGEVIEHLPNPGLAFAEASRVARRRVVLSVPLNGWADPTHEWRISMDRAVDLRQHAGDPTKGEQIVLTFHRGTCWPADYWRVDETWREQFPGSHE